ncbi:MULTISPECIES: outer membrane beta-barrel protein [Lacinutrix]|uniref:outer membrane beta-barrel protein n=1 Tax=Lacinutrix TaxID=291183 RepID=UPI0006E29AEF|nr:MULTISPECIES: outer membrane beta-barrel protein [Lacinutrix]QRM89495.1 outer membrane beta-barrel protein [Lacinutrix sp. WUR7]
MQQTKSKILLSLITFIISITFTFAQDNIAIKGKILGYGQEPLEYVSVAVLQQSDSTYVNSITTDVNGDFSLYDLPKDSLLLQLNYISYKPYFKSFVYNNELIDFNTITLEEDNNDLDEVVITVSAPIQIKNDTIAYNANSFKVNPGDNIEGLLKKLPGIELDADGKVLAQGEPIARIFVDGKEFFGGDPSIVLKNLSADAISKVEVIDKKSDEAELTGVDDGNKEVVINFTLKKSKKNRGFGKLSGGLGLDSRYFGNLNYNQFSSKTQFSIIGKFNNINVTGSNIQSFLENADGIDDDSGEDENNAKRSKSLNGFLTTAVTGIHIGHEFKDKESFNADYFFNFSDNDGVSNSKRISFSNNNNNNFDYNSLNQNVKTINKHNLNFNYINKASKTKSLTIKGRITSDKTFTDTNRDETYINDLGALATTNNQKFNNDFKRTYGNLKIDYYQRLAKVGRSFKVGLNTRLTDLTKNNNQNTFNIRNIGNTNESTRNISALRNEAFNTSIIDFNFKYTEPIAKNHYLKLDTYFTNKVEKEDVNQTRHTQTTTSTEDTLAFKYATKELSAQTRLGYSYNNKKFNFYSALGMQDLNRSYGVVTENSIRKNKYYFNPIVFAQYKPKRGYKYRINYSKSVKAPNSSQNSTVINDLNPNFIRVGNPDLKPEKLHNLALLAVLNNYKSGVSFWSKFQYQYATNAIIQSISIDDNFIRTRGYKNEGNRRLLNANIRFSKKIKTLGLRYSLKNNTSYSTTNSLINQTLNEVTSQDYRFSTLIENTRKNKIDIKVGTEYSINNTSFSIEQDLNREYSKQQYFTSIDYNFTNQLNVNSQFDYILFSDDAFSSNQKLSLWNAAISYSFSEQRNSIVKLVLIDLLNKDVDIYRNSTTNYFEETTSQSLGRYIVLSYTYKLNGSVKKS